MSTDIEQIDLGLQHADLLAPGPLRSLERVWQVFRYYRKRQLLARAWKITAGRWSTTRALPQFSQARLHEDACSALRQLLQVRSTHVDVDSIAHLHDLHVGTFVLLNERRALGRPVDWSGGSERKAERLWGFQLQYQEYLLDAAALGNEEAWNAIAGLIDEWLTVHSNTQFSSNDDTWHSYCISRRVPVWLMLLAQDRMPAELSERMLVSLAAQVEWLHQHCETDLGGNHLLENAYALVLAGLTLTALGNGHDHAPQEWLKTGQEIFKSELPRQILPHGEHYERSPMYHAHVLGNLLQLAIVSRAEAPELAQTCRAWATPMWSFLASILHADGEIPLFGDSCFGESYSVTQLRQLLSIATSTGEQANSIDDVSRPLEHSNARSTNPYWIWRHDNDSWIVDGGAAVENTLPAHGHCDLAGFEASIEGERWFVDAGVFGYSDDLMRQYCRSSMAHNIATIDNKNQFDIWSRFRMGYRVQPKFEKGDSNGFRWAHISHEAYCRVGAGRLHRIVAVTPDKNWICIDQCSRLHGRSLIGILRLGPGISVEQVSEQSWRLESQRRRCSLQFYGTGRVECRPGWYAPRFGVRLRINSLHYEASAADSAGIAWTLSKESAQPQASIRFQRRGSKVVEVVVTDRNRVTYKWDLVH